jgi:hypothetical protein
MWRDPDHLRLQIFDGGRQPDAFGWKDVNFYESEGDCTSEMGAGQFSIFGAVEEKGGRGSLPEERDEVKGEARTIRPLDGGGFRARRAVTKESGAVAGRNIHSGRTGNAERQLLACGEMLSPQRTQRTQRSEGKMPSRQPTGRGRYGRGTNQDSVRRSNSWGAVLRAPQWSALGTSQSCVWGLRAWMICECRTGMLLSIWP